jgi:hypothetical protein
MTNLTSFSSGQAAFSVGILMSHSRSLYLDYTLGVFSEKMAMLSRRTGLVRFIYDYNKNDHDIISCTFSDIKPSVNFLKMINIDGWVVFLSLVVTFFISVIVATLAHGESRLNQIINMCVVILGDLVYQVSDTFDFLLCFRGAFTKRS